MSNTAVHAADYLTIPAGKDFLGSVGTGLITIVLFCLLGGAVNRWRSHRTALARQAA